MTISNITLNTVAAKSTLVSILNLAEPLEGAISLANYFNALAGGNQNAVVTLDIGAVAASNALSFSTVGTNSETVTINGVVLTAATSGNGTTSFTVGTSATTSATALKSCINANATLTNQVIATSAGTVVTVTSKVAGFIGNAMTASESLNGGAWASAIFTGGTKGSIGTLNLA